MLGERKVFVKYVKFCARSTSEENACAIIRPVESFKNKNSRLLILFVAMAVLLPLLAALQYHWLGQVSEGASERLQSSLRASATAFRRDFNRELIRAYLSFHMDSAVPPADLERSQVERFENWTRNAPYPQIISDVFVVKHDEQGQPLLNRVNLQTRRLEPTDWSPELATLRERFTARTSLAEGNTTQTRKLLESFIDEIPALVVPLPATTDESAPIPPGFVVIKLDLNYLQREFIPALLQRHLLDASTEYDVAVTSVADPSRVIFSSRQPMSDFSSSDVSTRIFGMEADELEAFLRSESAPPATAEQSGPRPSRLVKLRLLRRMNANPTDSASHLDGQWQLSIKHRSGSLAAAVTSARRRNLAISFGILLLLAAGILITAISTRRAQRLAQQQINFVAGVTHELRTPLAVICSAGENLAHGIVDTPQKATQYGDVIYREGRRLTEMVEQVLEFAGAQSGKQRYDFRPIEVSTFIEQGVAASQTQMNANDFRVETTIPPNLPAINGDRAALQRVIQNLVSNAIKYDGQQRWARITAQKSANAVQISVEDRGIGMPAEELPHIFEPFYRGREAVAAQIEGSGVGLSIVKQIVDAHGGTIKVESAPGKGSTFTFSLPIAIPDESYTLPTVGLLPRRLGNKAE